MVHVCFTLNRLQDQLSTEMSAMFEWGDAESETQPTLIQSDMA